MTVVSVLEQTFDLYQRFFWRFAGTTAVVMVLLDLVTAVAGSTDSAWGGAVWAVGLLIGLIGTFWVQGALTFAVQDVRDGRVDTTIGELYASTRPYLGSLILAGLLAAVGIGLGLVLLIAPGLYLLARWALIVPAIVLERLSVGDAFSRSNALTTGHRWTVLGVTGVMLLASSILGGIIRGILSTIVPTFVGAWLGSLAAHCVTTPFLALAWTIIYFQLRAVAEPVPAAA